MVIISDILYEFPCVINDKNILQNQSDVLMEEIVETFILILLTLICKKRILNPNPIKSTFFYKTRLLEINKVIWM